MSSQYGCKKCKKTFATKHTLSRHMLTSKCAGKKSQVKNYKCECGYKTTLKSSLTKHDRVCETKILIENNKELEKLNSIISSLQSENKELKEKLVAKEADNTVITSTLQSEIKTWKSRIDSNGVVYKATLKAEVEKSKELKILLEAEIKKSENLQIKLTAETEKSVRLDKELSLREGFIKGLENHKNKASLTSRGKISTIKYDSVKPFTLELIEQNLEYYTYERFRKYTYGIIDFILHIISIGSTSDNEKSLVCTNSSRDCFYRLTEGRTWKIDVGAKFLNVCIDALRGPSNVHFERLENERKRNNDRELKEHYDKQITKSVRMIIGITNNSETEERTKLFNKIKTRIKKIVSI